MLMTWRWLGILALVVFVAPVQAASTHCTSQERIVFACPTGKKHVAVCAAGPLSTDNGALQYRFGPLKAPELLWPDAPAQFRSVASAGTLMFSGGGGAYLRFTKGPYGYVVFTAIGKGWGKKAGVVVEKDGKATVHLPCTGAVTSELGPALYSEAALPADAQGFDIP